MTKSYIYSNDSQILCQRAGGQSADEYFCVTDRLGSVRQLVDKDKNIVLNYTFNPFGATLESSKKAGYEFSFNSFRFTGQWWDDEFAQYYLRARMYDPALGRLTTRDPVFGKIWYPLTLHPYLYCLNNPVNRIDPDGEFPGLLSLLFGQSTSAKMRAGMASACAGIKGMVIGLVNVINMRGMVMANQLRDFGLDNLNRISTFYNNISDIIRLGGIKGTTVLSNFVANYTTLTTYDEQMSYIYGVIGATAPGLSADRASQLAVLTQITGEKFLDVYEDWDHDGE
ncbi:MAG: RHS repeat domain-containing protein [Planctomycetota bacterium]